MRVLRHFLASAAVVCSAAGAALAQAAPAPSPASDSLRFTSIVAGGGHSCGLTAPGRAYCWGRNNAGQLGDSTTTDHASPQPVAGGIVFRQIAAGAQHTCGVSTDDEPYCWGANEHGQLGNGARVNSNYPFLVASSLRATLITAGDLHTCATRKHWDKQDRAVCWGNNTQGQLGTMTTEDAALPTETFGVIQYVSIAAGGAHTCGATAKGKVFCWGANERGQLGNGSITASRVPFLSRMNRRVSFIQVVSGATHSCGLTSAGEIYCWGDNVAGQVGSGKGSQRVVFPTWLRDAKGFTALTAGGAATCAVKGDGSAVCWGSNAAGQLGIGAPGSRVPAPAFSGASWSALSLGPSHACGVRQDGTASCWGGTDR